MGAQARGQLWWLHRSSRVRIPPALPIWISATARASGRTTPRALNSVTIASCFPRAGGVGRGS